MKASLKACVMLAWWAAPALAGPWVVGEAIGADGGGFRYVEQHYCTPEGLQCTVEYRDRDGEVFARKQVDYRNGMHSPSLVLEDYRLGKSHRVEDAFGEDVVVDAGFDHYVRSRWEELASGREIRFPFLVAGRDDPFTMAARRDDRRGCAPQELCLVVEPALWLAALLVDPIRLVYDERRRLSQFRGVSNIATAEGETQVVEINYRYLEDSLAAVDR